MTTNRLESIDGVRAIAAMAVVLYHFTGHITLLNIAVGPAGSAIVGIAKFGWLGVPVFFVLSGFVIAMTADRYRFDADTGCRFFVRRMVRLAPPYWAALGIIVLVMLVGKASGLFATSPLAAGQVMAHLVYLQDLLQLRSLNVIFWTLCLEVQFYLVFVAAAICLRDWSVGGRAGFFIATAVGSFVAGRLVELPQAWFMQLWYQFSIGIVAYLACRTGRVRVLLGPALIGLGLFGAWIGRWDYVAVGLTGLFLTWATRRPTRTAQGWRPLAHLGRVSYSLYLIHGPIGVALLAVLRRGYVGELRAWASIVVATLLSLAAAEGLYRACELPSIRLSRAIRVGRKPTGYEAIAVPTGSALPVDA